MTVKEKYDELEVKVSDAFKEYMVVWKIYNEENNGALKMNLEKDVDVAISKLQVAGNDLTTFFLKIRDRNIDPSTEMV